MSQAHAFTLSFFLYCLDFIPFFASAVVPLPPISPNNDLPLTLYPTANLTTVLHGQIRCVLPYPHPTDPVNFRTCKNTLDRLLSYPMSSTPRTYKFIQGRKQVIKITSTVCAISLDREQQQGQITISLRQIVQSVKGILTVCSQFGEGGWQYMDPLWADWLVSVQGTGDLEEVEKIGDGTVGGDLLSSAEDK